MCIQSFYFGLQSVMLSSSPCPPNISVPAFVKGDMRNMLYYIYIHCIYYSVYVEVCVYTYEYICVFVCVHIYIYKYKEHILYLRSGLGKFF